MPKLPAFASDALTAPAGQVPVLLRRAKEAWQTGQREAAIRLLRRILAIDPMLAEAAGMLGIALAEEKQPIAAIEQFENALRIDPDRPDIWLCRGLALADAGRLPDALASFDRTLSLRPGDDMALVNRAGALFRLGRFADARGIVEALSERLPDEPGLANNLAMMLQWAGEPDEALREYARAIALNPDDPTAHTNLGMFLMYLGQLPAGQREYEWRFRQEGNATSDRRQTRPLWLGESSIAGKTVLFHSEQGFGDTLQFCRYATLAARAGARVILEVPTGLAELAATVPGVEQVITDGDPTPDHDLRCPMVSLQLAFGTTVDTIPAEVPYVRADAGRVAAWRERLASLTGLRIGLVWAGSSRFGSAELMATDARRSMPLSAMAPLAAIPECAFVSLQLGAPAEQAKTPPAGMILHDPTAALVDFAETAALIENLDLVISVDTAVVHLAGALAKPVWMLNRFDSCWRWFRDRDDSPWYPTLRQFRQTEPGNWIDVVDRVAVALRELAADSGDRR